MTYRHHLLRGALAWALAGCATEESATAPADATTPPPGDVATTDATDAQGEPDAAEDAAAVDTAAPPEVPVLPDLGPQPLLTPPPEWLALHDGTAVGNVELEEKGLVEYQRFEVHEAFRVTALRAQVDRAGPVVLRLLDDYGGDTISLTLDRELGRSSATATAADEWVTFAFDPPIEVRPGRIVYIANVWESSASPRLRLDASPTEAPAGGSAYSLVWLSSRIDPGTGTPTVYAPAPGDYLVELEVQRLDGVAPEHQLFERIEGPTLSRGAFEDVDGDGDLDLMADTTLHLGDGTGQFTPGTLPAGLSWNGGAFGDLDGDGDPDWFGTGDVDVVLRNEGGGVFTDMTAASGIDDTQEHLCNGVAGPKHVPTEASAILDVDNDGDLDVYQGNFICWDDGIPSRDKLWINNGDGTFEDGSVEWGLDVAQGSAYASRGVAPADYDNDGDMDVLVTNYRLHRSLHLRNDGGVLTDVGKETGLQAKLTNAGGGHTYGHSIGAAWADLDFDGRLDVMVARLAHPRFFHFSDLARLYYNAGPDKPFQDVTEAVGIRYQETPSNPNAWDMDNDGDVDLFWTAIYEGRRSQLYRNEWPDIAWTELSVASGLVVKNGWGSIVGDVDGDMDLDLLSRESFINRNRFGNYALSIRPRGLGNGHTNTSGIGARVEVELDGLTAMRERSGAHGTGCGDSPWLHVGLGKRTSAPVVVRFPATGVVVDAGVLSAGRYTISEDGTVQAD